MFTVMFVEPTAEGNVLLVLKYAVAVPLAGTTDGGDVKFDAVAYVNVCAAESSPEFASEYVATIRTYSPRNSGVPDAVPTVMPL